MSYDGGRKRFPIGAALTESLRRLSRGERKSLFALFTAALEALLCRYTGRDDILLGVPLADRDRPELQAMIGFLLQTHVLRTELAGDLSFRELMERVQQGVLKLYEHRSATFDQVVRAVHPGRNLSYSPLFQVMINWRDRDQLLSYTGLDGLEVESLLVDSKISKFDLTFILTDMGDEISAEIEYSSDLFDEARITSMFEHYRTLLEAVAENAEQPLDSLPLLTPAERHRLLVEWNDTSADYPSHTCIDELFEQQVERTPQAVAVEFEGKRVGYRELNERANRLANYLRKMGVGPDSFVGVCLARSPEAVVALLGVLKAGAAFVPLDPGYPRERLEFMITDAQISLVITETKLLPVAGVNGTRVVCLDSDASAIEAHDSENDSENVARTRDSVDVAYLLYTSGSTGLPKGVLGLHQGAVNRVAWMAKNFPVAPGEVFCEKTSLNFVDSIWEVFGPLLLGVPSVIISDEVVRDPAALVKLLATKAVTRIVVVPSLLRALLDRYSDLGNHIPALEAVGLERRGVAGRSLPAIYAAMPNATLLNLYGSTEVAADVTAHIVRPDLDDHATVPLGRPIDNTQLYVLDRRLQPVPIGVPGELYVGGAGLARGYHNRPEMTGERFIADPFHRDAESRLFRTGDLARYSADGTLEYLGRRDQQVKIRGFRVELGEIETALRSHPAIRAALALVRDEG